MFDLTQLRSFVVVAEELHFGRAAARLNMTQPPLSRQIQVLEHIVGARLLERTSRSVRLTVAGRSFLPEARRILKLSDSATRMAQRIALGKAGSIKIGFTAATAYSFLPRLVKDCLAALPNVDLSLREMVSGDQLEALETGQIDVGLLRKPFVRPDLNAVRVAAEPLVAALPEGHPLALAESVPLATLQGEPFIMYSPFESRYFYDLLTGLFQDAGIAPAYIQNLSQIHSMLALVQAGLGMAIVPQAAMNLNFGGVVFRPLQIEARSPVELFLVWPKISDNPVLEKFLTITKKLCVSTNKN
jgi:DNA-binding transcriptional LysR family regulator